MGLDGRPLAAGVTQTLVLAGQRGVPASAKVLSVNVTATRSAGAGSIMVWACGSQPEMANVQWPAGRTVANSALVPLSSSGAICVRSTVAAHVVIDVNGWWA